MGLGYIVVETADVEAWRSFGTQGLGLMEMPSGPDGTLYLKMDEHPFRIAVVPSSVERLACSGWELADDRQFRAIVAELRAAGHDVQEGTAADLAARKVNGLARVTDPGGSEIELFYGPVFDHTVFISPVGVSRFVTGGLGMGHMVMASVAVEETYRFYTELLGFSLSDVMRRAGGERKVRFTRCNPRHHSLGLVEGDVSAMLHFMIEAGSLDDVGRGFDRFLDLGFPVRQTIGKHTNDHMVSFYASTPSPFNVEFGFGGRLVDNATWTTGEITATSFWGHRPVSDPQP
jgi:3,4-dihydroxy-9,10-secoandrosta-1,3,5(10)-triene-9,17-dione 4,5-dioxygenase